MSLDILDGQMVELGYIYLHNSRFWVLMAFSCSKLKANVISFGAKMVVKWPIRPIIDQGLISRLCPYLTPNVLARPERI